MRGIIVFCLCTVSLAAPQGYNYIQGGAQEQQHVAGSFTPLVSGGNFFQVGQNVQQGNFGVLQQVQQQLQIQSQQNQQQAIITKRFFIHSAPEDVEEEYKEKHITVGVPKKNYNVVFIKSPSKTNKKTAIKISPALNEEKTVIYVLSKKTDAADIQAEVVEQPSATAKPEVFFIKYKTNEEANHAQEQIKAQYDALGGSTQVTDEGVAPVTSVIGSLDAAGTINTSVSGSADISGSSAVSTNLATVHTGTATGVGSNNAYLPPNFY